MRWGQQFRLFRDEVIAAMRRVNDDIDLEDEGTPGGTDQDEA